MGMEFQIYMGDIPKILYLIKSSQIVGIWNIGEYWYGKKNKHRLSYRKRVVWIYVLLGIILTIGQSHDVGRYEEKGNDVTWNQHHKQQRTVAWDLFAWTGT